MIFYIEKEIKNSPQVKKILKKFPKAQTLEIDNYKNIFDKKISWEIWENIFVLAKLKSNPITSAPPKYWHNWNAYFFKTSLNCIFDCSYCFLKWAFKNPYPVLFLNYEDIQSEIEKKILSIKEEQKNWKNFDFSSEACLSDSEFCSKKIENFSIFPKNQIRFYSSDYSDIQGFDFMSDFNENFIKFFEKFDNVMMETRTKSWNIENFLEMAKNWFVPKNLEIAFSLNPQDLIEKYEKWTASLESRFIAINKLLEKWFKVWLRFLPLLPVQNYEEIYKDFLEEVKKRIDMEKIFSVFATWLLYTKEDYKKILAKNPELDILYQLQDWWDWFFREREKVRKNFYKIFEEFHEKTIICLDEKNLI